MIGPDRLEDETAAGDELAAYLARGRGGRILREEARDYPAQGYWRPAQRKHWFVVEDAAGVEVTRSLKRSVAEMYL